MLLDEMDSDEEAFNRCIVTSDDEESSKENKTIKQKKTSRNQFDLMVAFSKEIDEQTTSRQAYDGHWNVLTEKLNEIGPPIRDCWEWRRVWSVYKYNQKRKQPDTIQTRLHQEPPINVRRPAVDVPTALSNSERIEPITIQTGEHRLHQEPPINVRRPAVEVPIALSNSERILQSIAIQVLAKLDQILNILKDTSNLLKTLADNAQRE